MGNKIDYETKKRKKNKEKALNELAISMKPFNIILIIITIVILLSNVFSWATIYNTDYGYEVSISGFNVFYCALTKNFTGTGSLTGDMAVPFFYYAETYCKTLASLTTITFFLTILSIVVAIIVTGTKRIQVHFISAIVNIILVVLYICCFVNGLAMNDSKILPIYCSNNPACSIQSFAIIPAIISLGAVAVSIFVLIKYFKTKSQYSD